jgi:hypothetical protein
VLIIVAQELTIHNAIAFVVQLQWMQVLRSDPSMNVRPNEHLMSVWSGCWGVVEVVVQLWPKTCHRFMELMELENIVANTVYLKAREGMSPPLPPLPLIYHSFHSFITWVDPILTVFVITKWIGCALYMICVSIGLPSNGLPSIGLPSNFVITLCFLMNPSLDVLFSD